MAISSEEIERRFTGVVVGDATQRARLKASRESFKRFAYEVADSLPAGREAAIVFTHLEEASFAASAAIARESK